LRVAKEVEKEVPVEEEATESEKTET